MVGIPPVSQPSDSKPIYLIVANDSTEKDGIVYYKTRALNQGPATLEFRGFQLTKTQAGQLLKDPYATTNSAKTEPKSVNRIIPWHNIIRIENTTYQKPQGEKYE